MNTSRNKYKRHRSSLSHNKVKIRKKKNSNNFIGMLKFSSKIISILTIFCLITGLIIRLIPTSNITPKAIANAKNQKGVIYLNPVAGGKDFGNTYKDRKSKDDNLKISLKIKDKLEKKNYKVIISRNDDSNVKKTDRINEANKKNCDLMISIDRYKKNEGKASGINAFISTSKNIKSEYLGASLINELNGVSGNDSAGTLSIGMMEDTDDNYIENSKSKMPSCMLLLGSVGSKDENEKFDKNLEEYAEAIVNGIDSAYYTIYLSGEDINKDDISSLSVNEFTEDKGSEEKNSNDKNDEKESDIKEEVSDNKERDKNYNNPDKYEDDEDSYGDLTD